MISLVDAHHHMWDLQEHPQTWINPATDAAINRNFLLEDLWAATESVAVMATVVVQSIGDAAETTHLLARAATTDLIAGVVGWADLTAPDLEEQIVRWRESRGGDRLVGLRHLVQSEPDPDWLDRPDVREGLRTATRLGLTFDLLVKVPQLPAAIRVVEALPETRFVLDHLGKPPFPSGDIAPWAELVRRLAVAPNVSAKVSGLVTEAAPGQWSPQLLQPAVDVAIEAFGVDRLMFGSDWPVCLLAADYSTVAELAGEMLGQHLDPTEQYRVMAENAISFYGLDVAKDVQRPPSSIGP